MIKLGPGVLFGASGAILAAVAVVAGIRHNSWSLDRFDETEAGDAEALPEAA